MKAFSTFVFAAVLGVSAAAQEALTAVVRDEGTDPSVAGAAEAAEAAQIAEPAGDTAEPTTETETAAEQAPEPDIPAFLPIDAREVSLADFQWIARPIVVFADTPADPRFQQQMEYLASRPDELTERDAVVIVDTDPAARSDIRLKLRPRGFMMVLIAKDGTVNLRKPFPWNVREITRSIDKMPLRQQEMRDANRPGG